jgi:hypothetical protein
MKNLSYFWCFLLLFCETCVCVCEQVETVGDKYMAVSGLPEPCQTHARCIARLALDMMDRGREVQVDGEPVVSGKPMSSHVVLKSQVICQVSAINNNETYLCFSGYYSFDICR